MHQAQGCMGFNDIWGWKLYGIVELPRAMFLIANNGARCSIYWREKMLGEVERNEHCVERTGLEVWALDWGKEVNNEGWVVTREFVSYLSLVKGDGKRSTTSSTSKGYKTKGHLEILKRWWHTDCVVTAVNAGLGFFISPFVFEKIHRWSK